MACDAVSLCFLSLHPHLTCGLVEIHLRLSSPLTLYRLYFSVLVSQVGQKKGKEKNDSEVQWMLKNVATFAEIMKIPRFFFLFFFSLHRPVMKTDKGQICHFPSEKVKGLSYFPCQPRMNHHSQAAVRDNMCSSVPRFTFKWNQMAVHSEMIYSNDDGNKSKVLFHFWLACTWDCCHFGTRVQLVSYVFCQDYYLHISMSGFINVLPKRLNIVSNQPGSSLGSPVCRAAKWYLDILLFPATQCHLSLMVYVAKAQMLWGCLTAFFQTFVCGIIWECHILELSHENHEK